jgi:uncharacterized protein (TIGR03067 family)
MIFRKGEAVFFLSVCLLLAGADEQNSDFARFEGKWEILRMSGEETGPAADYLRRHAKSVVLIVEKNRCGIEGSDKSLPLRFTVDPAKSPKRIDVEDEDGVRYPGIYKLNGDQLTVCIAGYSKKARPATFEVKDGAFVLSLKRKK